MKQTQSASSARSTASCESLETRNHFSAATLDAAFRGGQVQTHFGGTFEQATAGVVLKSGKLLVGGNSSMKNGLQDVFALYNRDGTLSNSFDGDGKLILTQAQTDLIAAPQKIVATPDGGAIIVGYTGFAKILPNGKLDTTFGFAKTGFVNYGPDNPLSDLHVNADGSFNTLVTSQANGKTVVSIIRNDAHANAGTSNTAYEASNARFLPDGESVAFADSRDGNYHVYRYGTNFDRNPNFGTGGQLDLTAAYHAFAKANGPFDVNSAETDNQGYPFLFLNYPGVTLTPDGGLLIQASLIATSAKLPSANGVTSLFITVDPAGKAATFHSVTNTGGGVVFAGQTRPNLNTPNGTFYLTAGAPVDVTIYSGSATLQASAADTDGATYVIGEAPSGSNFQGGFAVGRVLPFSGSISGVLFNDDNGNGKKDAAETVNAARTVFLDANNNGKLDTGEATATTDASGRYTFAGVGAGSYNVRRVLPSGYHVTTPTTAVTVTIGKTVTFDIGSSNKTVKDLVFA